MGNSLLKLITYCAMFFWLLPIARQYKQELFWYFLMLGLLDPISICFKAFTHISYNLPYYVFMQVLLIPIVYGFGSTKMKAVWGAVIVASTIASCLVKWEFSYLLMMLTHIIILIFFLRKFTTLLLISGKINLFLILLIGYETSTILKPIHILINLKSGIAYFVITTVFQVLFALFFTAFEQSNPALVFSLRKEEVIS